MRVPEALRDALRSRRRRGPRADSALERALRRAGLTVAGALLIAGAAAGWLIARAIGSRTMYLLVYGGILVLGIAWYLGRQRRSLSGRRSQIPARVRQGQLFEVEVTCEAKSRVSGVVLEERLHPHLGRSRRVPLAAVSAGRPFVHSCAL